MQEAPPICMLCKEPIKEHLIYIAGDGYYHFDCIYEIYNDKFGDGS